ncbi:GTPase HflX [Candidatus Zixiibacteriota bacterium]
MKSSRVIHNIPHNTREEAVLVGVDLPRDDSVQVEESLLELALLADTAGADVVDELVQKRDQLDPALFVGSGFVDRVGQRVRALDADLVIFDDDLSPAQVRNLEKRIEAKVVDRTTLILDIFAERAQTKEARTQVELAQLEYLLPRLTRAWSHLSRQVGGIGTRGPGETQLEVDRRLVRTRIAELQKELGRIEKQRETRRKARTEFFQITLVGYTNAGKSTLLNRLADSDLFVEDRLFATLDTATRSVDLPGGPKVLLTDTVGFIRKLPPGIVASFRSSLEEAVVADLLLHVVDMSHPWYEDHISSANMILDDLGILHYPTVMAFNKVDHADEGSSGLIQASWPDAVEFSAKTGEGIENLITALIEKIRILQVVIDVRIPQKHPGLANTVHELGKVIEREYDDQAAYFRLRTTSARFGYLAALLGEVPGASVTLVGEEAETPVEDQ